MQESKKNISWIPSLYFVEGIPYSITIVISVIMYKLFGLTNGEIALYTGWLYLPWVIKPFWSPILDKYKSKRFFIVITQLIIGICFSLIGLTIPLENYIKYSLIIFWLIAFNSATHDIAADGFYILALSKKDQAFWVGIRSTFYKISMLFCQGAIVIFAGYIQNNSGYKEIQIVYQESPQIETLDGFYYQNIDKDSTFRLVYRDFNNLKNEYLMTFESKNCQIINPEKIKFNNANVNDTICIKIASQDLQNAQIICKTSNIRLSWQLTMYLLGAIMIFFAIWHFLLLPKPQNDKANNVNFFEVFKDFFKKKNVCLAILFIFTYRLGEAQLSKISSMFLMDIGLNTTQIGLAYGTFGSIFMSLGGILGGMAISKKGLKYWLIPMILLLNVPDVIYLIISLFNIKDIFLITIGVSIEQFGYGFGFCAVSVFMLEYASGKTSSAFFAIQTGIMALGMMLPGMISGYIEELLGYNLFFVWVIICAIPSFIIGKQLIKNNETIL